METEEETTNKIEETESQELSCPEDESIEPDAFTFTPSEVEKEIEEEQYTDFKTQVEILVELGKQQLKPLELSDCYSSDRPGMHLEILPKIIFDTAEEETIDEVDLPKPVYRQTIDQGTLVLTEFKSSKAQSFRRKLLNSWTQYEPRLCSEEEYINVEKCSTFKTFLNVAEKRVTETLVQNNTADCFTSDLKSLCGENFDPEPDEGLFLSMKGSFLCSEGSQKRVINTVHWHPFVKDIFMASSLRNIRSEKRIKNKLKMLDDSVLFYIWSTKNQFIPKVLLKYFDDILVLKFNPTMPHLIVGGSVNGQLVLWNIEEKMFLNESVSDNKFQNGNVLSTKYPVVKFSATSSLDHIHSRGVTDLKWIPNHFEIQSRGDVKRNLLNESFQILTCGLDGCVRFWDLRSGFQSKPSHFVPKNYHHLDGTWEPFYSIEILSPENKKNLSVTSFTLKENIKIRQEKMLLEDEDLEVHKSELNENGAISTEFYAGCDNGYIICGSFKLVKNEAGKYVAPPSTIFMSPHSGCVTTIARSPFIDDVFFSTGSRSLAIWKHDIMVKPVFLRKRHAYVTSGEWSEIRPALFFLGFEDGSVEIWDMLYNIYEPYLMRFVSTSAIKTISLQKDVEYVIAVGDSQGVICILSLPPYLCIPLDNELNLMTKLIETEAERKCALSYKKDKITEEAKEAPIKKELAKLESAEEFRDEDTVSKSYDNFLELEHTQLAFLGLIKEEMQEEIIME